MKQFFILDIKSISSIKIEREPRESQDQKNRFLAFIREAGCEQ